jgi:hypothetical protein
MIPFYEPFEFVASRLIVGITSKAFYREPKDAHVLEAIDPTAYIEIAMWKFSV